jgi:hypothetical protein
VESTDSTNLSEHLNGEQQTGDSQDVAEHLGGVMKRRQFAQLVGLACLGMTSSKAQAVEKIDPDPAAVELCSKLLEALCTENYDARIKAVLPLVHSSLRNRQGTDLDRTVKDFSFKKASGAAKLYGPPAVVTEVHKGRESTIGFRETAERGRTDKYFVAKLDPANGRPAPLHVFWPSNGGKPSIVNMGSL